MSNLYYDDFVVGQEFISAEKVITQDQIDQFAEITGDRNPLHISEEFASKSIFKSRIAHGLLVLSLALGLWYREDITRQSIIALIGIDKVSFKAPVYPSSLLHLVSKVVSKRLSRSRPGTGIVTFKDQMKNEKNETVMEAERTLLLRIDGN